MSGVGNVSRRVLTIFIASPGDLGEERRKFVEVVEEVNKIKANQMGVHLEPRGWKQVPPGQGRPQELINKEIRTCAVFVLLLWKRWGTPSGAYSSGTEEEFELAREHCKASGVPHMMLYFKDVPADRLDDPGEQLKKVLAFRQKLDAERAFLYHTFSDAEEWESRFRLDLSEWLSGLDASQPVDAAEGLPSAEVGQGVGLLDDGTEKERVAPPSKGPPPENRSRFYLAINLRWLRMVIAFSFAAVLLGGGTITWLATRPTDPPLDDTFVAVPAMPDTLDYLLLVDRPQAEDSSPPPEASPGTNEREGQPKRIERLRPTPGRNPRNPSPDLANNNSVNRGLSPNNERGQTLEEQIALAEQNTQRLAGQFDEILAISNVTSNTGKQAAIAANDNLMKAHQALVDAEAERQRRSQAVSVVRKVVDSEQEAHDATLRELERATQLIESGVASRTLYEEIYKRMQTSQAALATARVQLEDARRAYDQSLANVHQKLTAAQRAQELATNVISNTTGDLVVREGHRVNERVVSLDDYVVQNTSVVLFRKNSAALSSKSKQQLDEIARQALKARGYVLEISGLIRPDGDATINRGLSQRRADAVIRYLTETHKIPLRRIVTSTSHGQSQPVADNSTRGGRQHDRGVEVKILVSRSSLQSGPQMP
jgi:outer membrane protein OmpA-like peptidoglycan-associated protein